MIVVESLAKRFGASRSRQGRPVPGSGRFAGHAPSGTLDGRPENEAAAGIQAVADVAFTAADGCITGLLGPNGAGKTTTLRMLAGLIEPDAGTLLVDGIDVRRAPRAALARMGVLSDARGLYPRLSARENIVYYGALQGMSRDAAHARAESLAETLDMKPLLERRTEGFSQGERMKTALARALVHDPANIVLDEPTNGLDVLATRALRESLRWLRGPDGGGKCILFSTHIMQEVERLCDQVVVVARGRTVAAGTVAELLERTGENDFEEAFVRLAFDSARAATARIASPPEASARAHSERRDSSPTPAPLQSPLGAQDVAADG
ncbi:MAG: ATP-binding cassette domain-containing protein [Caldimonas sp.]